MILITLRLEFLKLICHRSAWRFSAALCSKIPIQPVVDVVVLRMRFRFLRFDVSRRTVNAFVHPRRRRLVVSADRCSASIFTGALDASCLDLGSRSRKMVAPSHVRALYY